MDRKIAGIGIGAMLVIGLFTMMGFAFAQDAETAPATGFVDEDSDGVCDNFVDADGNGVCDHKGQREGFVDADGNGVCDHKGQREGCPKMKNGFRGGCHRVAAE